MAVKKTAKRAPAKKKKTSSKYECGVCGLVVSTDNICSCEEACDIVCCGTPMKAKKK
jgi:hypothetical protein